MKATLFAIPLSLAAAMGVSSAQAIDLQVPSLTELTLFGVMDADLTYEKVGNKSQTSIGSGGNVFSRLGFRGKADLGSGMAASFWLEMGVTSNTGAVLATNTNNQGSSSAGVFSRRSTVSLESPYGEVRLGRDYTPTFWSSALFDPFGTGGGIGANHLYFDSLVNGFTPTGTRASNSIGYFLPKNLGGAYGQVMQAFGQLGAGTATSRDGNYSGARLGWTDKRFDGALAYGVTRYASGNYKQANLGLSYLFDASLSSLKLVSELYGDSIGPGSATSGLTRRGRGGLAGFLLPVGPGVIKGSYAIYRTNLANDPTSSRFSLGYVYNFSKAASVYVTGAHVENRHGATASLGGVTDALTGATSGVQSGITYAF